MSGGYLLKPSDIVGYMQRRPMLFLFSSISLALSCTPPHRRLADAASPKLIGVRPPHPSSLPLVAAAVMPSLTSAHLAHPSSLPLIAASIPPSLGACLRAHGHALSIASCCANPEHTMATHSSVLHALTEHSPSPVAPSVRGHLATRSRPLRCRHP